MPRHIIAFLVIAAMAFAPTAQAQFALPGTSAGPGPQKATNLNSSRSNIYRKGGDNQGSGVGARATTVKSSKSNTSDRATTVKSSKSNTSDRATTVKSSKSNTSDRATTVKSSKSNTSN